MRGRPIKKGIDYYPLNVDFLQDIKVRKIMRGCGAQSIAILISLLSSIYRDEGYYVGWDSDMTFLVADEVGASEGAVLEVVNKAVQVDFFDKDIFEKYKVLTSRGIQKRFLEAVRRRKEIEVFEEYLLVNIINDYNKSINVYIKSINDSRNKQRKEKNSKEKKRKENNTTNSDLNLSLIAKEFEKGGFGTINTTVKEIMIELVERYPAEWITNAMKIAVKSNARNLRYVEGILSRWENSGGMVLGSNKDQDSNQAAVDYGW